MDVYASETTRAFLGHAWLMKMDNGSFTLLPMMAKDYVNDIHCSPTNSLFGHFVPDGNCIQQHCLTEACDNK